MKRKASPHLAINRALAASANSIGGRRGQAFMKELLTALDAMPRKELIDDELVSADGQRCALGALGDLRAVCLYGVSRTDHTQLGRLFDVAPALIKEVVAQHQGDWRSGFNGPDGPKKRWIYVRNWIASRIVVRTNALTKHSL